MIEGLRLTMTGEEICAALNERIRVHQRRAEHWRDEAERTPESQTDEHPLLPEHMCENAEEEERWRVDVLTFIRDHIDASEVYRLDQDDLAFGELLPEKPGWMEQEEYERDNALRFGVERLYRSSRGFDFCRAGLAAMESEG
jgi:hypothetical protein